MKQLKSKKILTAILSAVILATTLSAASCGNKDGGTTNNPNIENSTTDIVQETEPVEEIDENQKLLNEYVFPDKTFDGYEFKILVRGQADEWDSQDIISDEETGEVVSDAVYRRNVELEERFNVKLTGIYTLIDQQLPKFKKSVQAGDRTYDAVMLNFETASQAAKAGLLVNLAQVPNINLSMPWWDQSLMEETSVMNKIYYATGDVSIMDNDGTWTMMFNKEMARDFGLPDIYELVKTGQWTIDKFMELSKGVTKDLDGSGTLNASSQYAFSTTPDSVQGLFFSTGLRIVKKDASDVPYFALTGDSVMTNLEKIYDVFRGPENFTLLSQDYGNHLIVQAAFEENRSLFYAEVMQCVIRLRQMDTEFGVIPLPKADESQETYHTNIHKWASATIAIPADIDDLDRTGLIVEALAHGGMKYITPAYYDIALKSKHTRDEESSEMLDIIFAGRSADLGYVDNVGTLMTDIVTNVTGRKNTFSSTIEKKEARIATDIGKIITSYEELE